MTLDQDIDRQFREIYGNCRSKALGFLRKLNRLSDEENQDIFQEAVVCLFSKIRKGDFQLTCKLDTYLLGVCKYMSNNYIKKHKRTVPMQVSCGEESFNILENTTDGENAELKIEKDEEVSILKNVFCTLGQSCRRLLGAFYFKNQSYKEIVDDGLYTSEDSAKTNKNKCVNKMRDVYQSLK